MSESQIILASDVPFEPGTIKPEADYLEIERLGKKLGIPVPLCYVTVEATNPDGSPGERFSDRSRTFNRNFWNWQFAIWANAPGGTATFAAGFLALKDSASTVRPINFGGGNTNNPFPAIVGGATVGVDTMGILVGTGTTAESFEHNALVTKVAQGTGSGQLSHAAQSATGVSYNSGTKVWTATLARIFNNNSGGTIVVAETGIYAHDYNNSLQNMMFCRDLLGATVSVLNAGQLTVTYTMTLTFPA